MPPFNSPGGRARILLFYGKRYYAASRVQRQICRYLYPIPPFGSFQFNLKLPKPDFCLQVLGDKLIVLADTFAFRNLGIPFCISTHYSSLGIQLGFLQITFRFGNLFCFLPNVKAFLSIWTY
jgi:hypothetical protein